MRDDDDMDRFIAEQRNKIARDRDTLDRNPTSAVTEYIMNETEKRQHMKSRRPPEANNNEVTENISKHFDTNQQQQQAVKMKPPTPQLFKLGEDYLKQKEKLKEELRLEYRKALAEKQVRTTGIRGKHAESYVKELPGKSDPNDLGLSLPIRDHLSAKTNQATKREEVKESYQDLLERKRRQEKVYRNEEEEELDDRVLYREKPRRKYVELDDDEDRHGRRMKHPPKRRPRYHDRYYDEPDSLEEEEEILLRKLRARRQRKRMTQRYEESDEDDESLFERVRPPQEPPESKRRLNSAQNRDVARRSTMINNDKENDLRSKSAPPEQEFTGLQIGKVTSANTVQRRKDEYKFELQKQMEQKDFNRKREKELELRIDASGANDRDIKEITPRKPSNKRPDSPHKAEKPKKKGKKKTTFKSESSDSSSEEERQKLPRPAYGYYPPAPPKPNFYQAMPQQFPSQYDEAYYYYGARNPLDVGSGAPPPASYPPPMNYPQPGFQQGVSPLMAAAGSYKNPASDSIGARSSHEPSQKSILSSKRTGSNVESSLVSDESRDGQMKREKMLTYQEELREQMSLKEKKVRAAKEEQERYDRKIEMEAQNYNPWGKGGAGAPMRDIHGNLVSDLRQMHLENEDLVRDPNKAAEVVRERQATNVEEMKQSFSPRAQDFGSALSPRFGRSNPFEMKETVEQKSQKDIYKENLQKQIEERRRFEDERKEKQRIEDEKEEKRMEEQNRRMQEEYENEKRKQREKIEQKRKENEEMQRALEEKRKEGVRIRKEEEERLEQERSKEKERELQERLNKPKSPPIHSKELHGSQQQQQQQQQQESAQNTYRSQITQRSTTPPRPQMARERVHYERARSPVVEVRPEKSRESKRISRELSALRKQLLSEQRRIETQLRSTDTSSYKQVPIKTETLVDLSRTRQRPVQVRRPPTVERPSSNALKEFTDFKHRQDDTASLRMFRIEHPETPKDANSLEQQQQQLIRNQLQKLETLRTNKHMDQPEYSRKSPTKSSRNGFSLIPPSDSYASLLEADSTYIPIPDTDDVENQPPSFPSSRAGRLFLLIERRRISKRNEQEEGLTYRAPDSYSINSLTSLATLDVDRLANRNENRLDKLKQLTGDEVSLTDPDDILDRFVNQHRSDLPDTPDTFQPNARRPRKGTSVSAPRPTDERPPSINTIDTEPWLRPGTGPPATAT
ncbi:centrosome and spindle pole associated protein 1-like isoform X3 [Ciona intestinalis]